MNNSNAPITGFNIIDLATTPPIKANTGDSYFNTLTNTVYMFDGNSWLEFGKERVVTNDMLWKAVLSIEAGCEGS